LANVSDRLREALERLDQAIDRLDANATVEAGSMSGENGAADTAALAARLDKMIQRVEAALAD
jgi:Arc/MetJ-type ribon-helix-helix transcriptional regulator